MPMKNIIVLISAIMAIPEKKDDKIQSVKITQPLISTKHPIPKAIEFSSVQDLIKSIVGDSDEETNENRQNRSYTNDEHEKNIQVKKQPSPITPTAHPIPKAIEFSSVQDLLRSIVGNSDEEINENRQNRSYTNNEHEKNIQVKKQPSPITPTAHPIPKAVEFLSVQDLIRSIVGNSDEEPEENSQNKSKINYNVEQDDKNSYPSTNSELIHAVKATEYPSVQHLIRSITMRNLNEEKDDTFEGTSTNDLKRNLIGVETSLPSTNQPIAKAIEYSGVQHLLKSMVKDSEEEPDKNYQDLNLTNKEDRHNNTMLVPNTETLNLQNDTQETKKRSKDKKSKKNKKAGIKSRKSRKKFKDNKRKKKKTSETINGVDFMNFTDLPQGDDPNSYLNEFINNEDNHHKFDDATIGDSPPVVNSEINDVNLKAVGGKPNNSKVVSDKPHTADDHIQNTKFQISRSNSQSINPQNIITLTFNVSRGKY